MPVTADTITDAQIRELAECDDVRSRVNARMALGRIKRQVPGLKAAARARCAEILNARMVKP
jgi:hypothetical protein